MESGGQPEPAGELSGEPSDEALYYKVRRGDLLAFDTLCARYERRLFGFICKMVHNHHDAEDLFHEAFVSVLRSREVSFDRGNFCGWLYRIARDQCLNHLQLRSTGLAYEEMAEVLQIPLGTVKLRMNQMTQRLRDELARRLGDPAAATPTAPQAGSALLTPGEPAALEKEYTAHELRRN